jgi:hypothetical protein
LCSGCASVDVRATAAPEANLRRYHTYAWYHEAEASSPPLSLSEQYLRQALRDGLQRHGVVMTTGEPDFLVAYHVVEPQAVTITDWADGQHGWAPRVTSYSQGMLVVDFIDRETNKIFWRGTATGVLVDPRAINGRRIERAVGRLVADYVNRRETVRPRM